VLGEAGGSLAHSVEMTTDLTHSGYVDACRTART